MPTITHTYTKCISFSNGIKLIIIITVLSARDRTNYEGFTVIQQRIVQAQKDEVIVPFKMENSHELLQKKN